MEEGSDLLRIGVQPAVPLWVEQHMGLSVCCEQSAAEPAKALSASKAGNRESWQNDAVPVEPAHQHDQCNPLRQSVG